MAEGEKHLDSPRVEEAAAAYEQTYDPAVAGVRAGQRLVDVKFERKQADAVVLAVRELAGDLATKNDLEIAKSELRVEMAELKTELKTDIADVKTEIVQSERRLEKRMGELKSDIVQSERRLEKRMDEMALEFKGHMNEMALESKDRLGEITLEAKDRELRLTKAMNRNLLWMVGILLGGIAIATAVILDALKV